MRLQLDELTVQSFPTTDETRPIDPETAKTCDAWCSLNNLGCRNTDYGVPSCPGGLCP